MIEKKQGAAEWLRGIVDESYRKETCPTCVGFVKTFFGIECGEMRSCGSCFLAMVTAIADRIDAERALPEGVEWPRFEDGEPVRFGDEVGFEGEVGKVARMQFELLGWAMTLNRNLDLSYLSGAYGERVKRPTPKVLDADGAPINVGDEVYLLSNGRKGEVTGFYEENGVTWVAVSYELGGDRMTVNTDGKALTHKRPDSWERLEEDADKCVCEYAGAQKSTADPDRYSCIECPYDDLGPHTDAECNERMRLDIVRRAKALAEAGDAE